MRLQLLGRVSVPRLLAAASAVSILASAPAAFAGALNFTASDYFNLDGTVIPTTPQSGPAVDILHGEDVGDVFALTHVYGGPSADFGSRSSGEGNLAGDTWDVTGNLTATELVANTTLSRQNYSLTFTINGGDVQAYAPDPDNGAEGKLSLEIDFGPNVAATSTVDLTAREGATKLTKSGFDLGGTYDDTMGDYTYDSQTLTVALGALNPGQSELMTYKMDSSATGFVDESMDVDPEDPDCDEGPPVVDVPVSIVALTGNLWGPRSPIVLASDPTEGCEPTGSKARTGDPTTLSSTPFFISSVTAIPEPSSALLFAGGLAGFAIVWRRRRARGRTGSIAR